MANRGVTEWKAKVKDLEREREKMREEIRTKDQFIEYLESSFKEQDEVIDKAEGLSDKLRDLKDEYRRIEGLEKFQQARIRELEEKLKLQGRQIKKKGIFSDTALSEIQSQNEMMTKEIKDLKDEIEARKLEVGTFKEDFNTERREREEMASRHADEYEKWTVHVEELKEEKEKFVEEYRVYVHDLVEGKEKLEEDLKNANDEKKNLSQKLEDQTSLLQELDEQCEGLREERDAMKEELNKNRCEYQGWIRGLEEKLQAVLVEKGIVDDLIRHLEDEKIKNGEATSRLSDENASLSQQLKQAEEEKKELQQKLKVLEQKGDKNIDTEEKEKGFSGGFEGQSAEGPHIDFHHIQRADMGIIRAPPIGEGAWGTINSGEFHGCKVAVKQPHWRIMHKSTVERMKREVSNMARVHHPNLATFIGANFDDGKLPFIVIELMEVNLRGTYEKRPLTRHQIISIFKDVAYALHYLHSLREPLIHRDVSSPNILLNPLPGDRFLAKVGDFGSSNLAKFAITAAEGAPIYSAPESAQVLDASRPQPKLTVKMDTYSYGVLLCEVVNCRLPADRDCWDEMLTVARQWEQVYTLIVECTKFDPAQRPTMRDVINHLKYKVVLRL